MRRINDIITIIISNVEYLVLLDLCSVAHVRFHLLVTSTSTTTKIRFVDCVIKIWSSQKKTKGMDVKIYETPPCLERLKIYAIAK